MKWLLTLLLLQLSGCSPKPYFRTEIHNQPCITLPDKDCAAANLVVDLQEDYALSFVEFDDDGHYYDKRQAESLLQWLSHQSQPQYVAIYTHGWHHNANDTDNNVRRFKESLRDIKQRNPSYQVLGIYLGWRGETLDIPWLRALTFWDRKAVSETLGRNDFMNLLLRIETLVKSDMAQRNRLLTIGHSLGATVLLNALQPVWMQRLSEFKASKAGFGDLVVLVNPAFEARRFVQLRSALMEVDVSQLPQMNAPLLLIAASEADTITKNAFTLSQAVPALFKSSDSTYDASLYGLSEWALAATAVGHVNELVTHRLEATSFTVADSACGTGTLDKSLKLAGPSLTNVGDAIWPITESMLLRHLHDKPAYDPVWVVQTDKFILPNHGFMNRKPFWCFIERAMG